MKRHGSLNRVYRLVRSEMRNAWVVAAEMARGRGKGSSRKLVAAALAFSAGIASAAPIGGQVVAGAGSIAQFGFTTTVRQSSQNLSLNWRSFNIAPQETVNFLQPSASAVAVNRILDTNGTQILGRLNANGQVYLINPNGILFGQGAQVNVGGLVASTLALNDATLNGNARSFSGNGTGSVVNQGTINAAIGGYVALLGNKVSNQGAITAHLGTVALGAGSAATLTFTGNSLFQMQVDQSVLASVAENGGLIRADGGMVVMTAGAKDALLASVVNNTGIIEARTVEQHEGTIVLGGGMQAGTVNVGGTLDASASNGGNGGFIETSAAQVKVANDAKVTTAASLGLSGTWLIDPVEFTIAAGSGALTISGIGASTLSTSLGSGNVSIATSATTAGNGDIFVNDVVSWAANRLTLTAHRNININANLNGSGTASLALEYGQGAVAAGNTSDHILRNGAQVNLPAGANFSTRLGSNVDTTNYTVITSLGAQGSTTGTDLQGMSGGLAGNYALGSNIDAAATSIWNANAGFAPIGSSTTNFTGAFDGLGHTVSNLNINRPATNNAGLFGQTGSNSAIRNVGLVGGGVRGANYAGGLVGLNSGTISNSYATGSVSGSPYVGGLVGYNYGTISNSYATGSVSGSSLVGGLVGGTTGPVSNSYATGSVSGTGDAVGGLVGFAMSGPVSNSYATGSVSGANLVGGLVGLTNFGTLNSGFWNTETSGRSTSAGGTGLTTAQMMAQANFTSATIANGNVKPTWDFTNTWVMYEGLTYPLLRSYMTPLSVTATNATRTYDGQVFSGGNGVTYTSTPNSNLLGTVSFSGTSQGATNAGNYVITPGGVYSNQQGYLISYANGALTVNAAAISLSGTRTYDATANVAAGIFTLSGLANGEILTLTGTGTVANKNVGSAKAVTLDTLALGNGTGLASNYTFTGGTQTANITAANLAVTGVTASNKVYDATTTATLGGTAVVSALGTDVVTVGGSGSGVFANKNVGTGKAVTVSGFILSGTDAGNYAIVQPTGVTANITAANLAVTGVTASNKVYDATTTATLGGTAAVSALGTDVVTVGGSGSGVFADKNVGTGKAVTVSGFILSGTDAGNYAIVQPTGVTANITPATLNFTAIPASFIAGQTPSGLSGTVSGFAGAGVLTDATTGTLAWTSTASASSQPGQYPITGGGLTSTNYVFVQAAGNATALTLQPGTPPTNVVLTTAVLQSMLGTPNSGSGGPVNNNDAPLVTLISPPPSSSSPPPATTSAPAPAQTPPAASIPVPPPLPPVATSVPGSSPLSAASSNLGAHRITSGQPFTVPLPDSTFVHLDTSAQVTLTISQTDGQPLPSWMTFDVKSGVFTGQAPPGATGAVGVRVVARDQKGFEAVSTIQVVIE